MTVETGPREIDRKLHRIVVRTETSENSSAIALARLLEGRAAEFTYYRGGELNHVKAPTIADYILFARDIGLLDGNLKITRSRTDVRSLDSFQQWLADRSLRYLSSNNASLDKIRAALVMMLSSNPRELPTLDNVHKHMKLSLSRNRLGLSLKVISLLRPRALRMLSRRVVIVPEVLVG